MDLSTLPDDTPITVGEHLDSAIHHLLNRVVNASTVEEAKGFFELFADLFDMQKSLQQPTPKPNPTPTRKSVTVKEN